MAVSRQVTAFRKRSGVRKGVDACGEEAGGVIRRTRSASCFVRVKWQKMTYNDVQVCLQDTPINLKLLLEKVTGVPVVSQKLSCGGKLLKDNLPLCVHALLACALQSFNTICMSDSGVKSGVLMQLLGQPAVTGSQSIAVLCKRVFESAKKGDTLALQAALNVNFRCCCYCCIALAVGSFDAFVFRRSIALTQTAAGTHMNIQSCAFLSV